MCAQAVPSSAMAKPWEMVTPPPIGAPLPGWRPAQQVATAEHLPSTWNGAPVRIAEITVDGPYVLTPMGTIDRAAARWSLSGRVPAHESTPTWATAAAILLALFTCFVSLLFLLVKETDMWSSTLIVTDGRTTFTTTVYSGSLRDYEAIEAAIAWARAMPQAPPALTS